MAINKGKKIIPVTAKLDEPTFNEIEQICAIHDRHRSYVVRELMIRGLGLYRRDGRLRDDSPPGDQVENRPFAEVVAMISHGSAAADEMNKHDIQRMIAGDLPDIATKRRRRQ